MKILTNLGNFFYKNKKNIIYTFTFFIFIFCFNDITFAADPKEQDVVIKGLNVFLGIAAGLLGVLTMLIGLFLRPEWTSGSVIGLDTQLKTMWILISNVVYFVFAFIFVTIAFMNIIGKGDNYELKKAIPKFIVGVLMVPFSWFFVQFILSISGILTVAVLSLPYNTFPALEMEKKNIPTCEDGYNINLSNTGANIIGCKGGEDKRKKITIKEFLKQNDNGGLYSIMTIYTYGVMKIDEKGLLYAKEIPKGITSVWALSLKIIFDLIFIVVYTLLLVALFLAFMTRGFALWFYAIFSPVFGLLYYFGKGKDGMGDGAAKKFNLTEFIGLAFVPVYVAAALSFGILFLFVAGKGFEDKVTTGGTNNLIKLKGDTLTIGNNTFTSDAMKTANDKADGTGDLFKGFTGPIGALILEMLGLAVMWLAVMAALKQSSITANVTSPIEQFGSQIGSLIAKAPTYAPILPGGLSATGLSQVGSSANQYFSNKSMNTGQDFMKRNNLFQSEDVNAGTKMTRLGDKLNISGNHLGEDEFKELSSAIKSFSDPSALANNKQAQNTIKLFGEKLGVVGADKWTLKNPKEVADALREINNKGVEARLGNIYGDKKIERDPLNELTDFIKDSKTTSETSTPTSTLPNTIIPTKNGDNININITKLDNDGKETPNKVDIVVDKNGKVDNLSKLEDALKTYTGKYNETEFKKLLSDIGIKDTTQIDELVKKYFNKP